MPPAVPANTAPDTPDDAALALEFDVLARRAGLHVPEERRAMLLAGFKDLRRMATLLRHPPRTAADEPASTFDIRTVTRGIEA